MESKLKLNLNELAKSTSQQRLFGMVYAYKEGKLDTSKIDDELLKKIKKIAKGISKKDAEDFARTKHKGLPDKVEQIEFVLDEIIEGIIYG